MRPISAVRNAWSAIGGLAAATLLLLAGAASASAIPLVPVHLPPVTQRTMDALQSEIVDARTKPLHDRDHQHPRPGGTIGNRR